MLIDKIPPGFPVHACMKPNEGSDSSFRIDLGGHYSLIYQLDQRYEETNAIDNVGVQ